MMSCVMPTCYTKIWQIDVSLISKTYSQMGLQEKKDPTMRKMSIKIQMKQKQFPTKIEIDILKKMKMQMQGRKS